MQKSPGELTLPRKPKVSLALSDAGSLFELMRAEEVFIKKSDMKLNIWVDFYETEKTDEVLLQFAANLNNLSRHIIRLSIVGFLAGDKRRFHRLAKKSGICFPMPLQFFEDPEEAKTWLVSGG